MKIRITREFEEKLFNIFQYIAEDSPVRAENFVSQIKLEIKKLENFPQMGVKPKHMRLAQKGYRMLIYSNYLVFYLIKDNCINIASIQHGAKLYDKI